MTIGNRNGDGRTAIVYVLLAGLQRGMPLLILPLISKAMDPSEYGAASMLTASSLLIVTVLAAPLEALVFRLVARAEIDEGAPSLLRVCGLYCYVVVPAATTLGAACLWLAQPEILEVSGHIWAIELFAIGFQPAMTYYALPVVQASRNLPKFSQLAVVAIATSAVSKLALVVVWQYGVLGWAVSDLLTAASTALIAYCSVRLHKAPVKWRDIKGVAHFALPLIPHRVSFWAISSLSRPMLALVSSLFQVGLLSLGLNIASVANLILTETNRAFLPRYSRESFPAPTVLTFGPVRIQLVLAVVVPASVGSLLAVAGQYIFDTTYWSSFQACGILLLGQAAYGLYLVPTNYIVQAAGRTRAVAFASTAGASIMAGLLLILGRENGAMGAAYATAAGFLAMFIAALAITKMLGISIRWHSWQDCGAELIIGLMAVCMAAISLSQPVGSSRGMLIAGTSLLLGLLSLARLLIKVRSKAE